MSREIAKEKEARTIIQTAAASQLGQQFSIFAQWQGIRVINIVKTEEQRRILTQTTEFGKWNKEEYVLISEE